MASACSSGVKRASRQIATTLLEALIAIGILGGGATASISTLLQMNKNATLSRLRTGAGTVAQNQIDYILSIQPYNPQKNQIPPELVVGTRTLGSATAPTVPIYTDPQTGVVNTLGWVVTDVADMAQGLNGIDYSLRRATVTVFYKFKNKTYSVELTTMRASDI
jgi:type II secretory pathway pseudopilin PulG